MAEARSKRMQVVLMLAQRREDEASDRLRDYREQVQQAKNQLQELQDYAEDYRQKVAGQKTELRIHELVSYRNFLQRLAEAEQEQLTKLQRMLEVCDQLEQQWRQLYQQRKSLEDLIGRLKLEEGAAVEKRLQKELDEFASQAAQRKKQS